MAQNIGLFHLIGIHPLLMTFVPGEEEVALGCPRGLKRWLSQGGSQAFWPVPGGSKAFFWLSKGGSEARRPVPGGSKCHVPGVGYRWQIVPWGSKLSQYVPRGLTLFLRVVLGGSQIYVISRGWMPIKWNSPSWFL